MNRDVIAVVDYNDYTSGNPSKREQFIQSFGDSFANMGFAIVRNHGVTAELKAKLQKQAKKRKISVSELIKTAIRNRIANCSIGNEA